MKKYIPLKYGFCKKLLLLECNSDQLNISWPFLSSLFGGCNSKATLNPPKSDEKNGQEMFNWSELHSERSNFLQNPYFKSRILSQNWRKFHYQKLPGLTRQLKTYIVFSMLPVLSTKLW
jgi:hypothetical protein